MAKSKDPFIESLKAALAKLGLPGSQRDAVQWLLVRYIGDVNIIATLNQVALKRQQLLDARMAEILLDLNDLADTETPTPVPSTN